LEDRLKNLDDTFLESLYRNICRSLFEKDKLLFSCLLAVKLMGMADEIDMNLFMFMLTGGVDVGEAVPENPTTWISTKSWGELNRLGKFKAFKGVVAEVTKNLEFYQTWYDNSDPAAFELGERWKDLDKFEFMCFLRCIR
jgi:dynein heavy chain